jgi:uncharacterized protein
MFKMIVIIYSFVEDFIQKRKPYRQEHLDYIRGFEFGKKIAAGGALSPELCRGLILFRGTFADAAHFVKEDPYVKAGIVQDHLIGEWSLVVGDALPQLEH